MNGSVKRKRTGATALVIKLLQAHPDGLTIAQMRQLLPKNVGDQMHLDRRVRYIKRTHHLETEYLGDGTKLFKLGEEKQIAAASQISERLRSAALHLAHGRCQMCGQSIKDDGIKLQADHKIPLSWGGESVMENLWAICEACNRGKRNYFSSFDEREMAEIVHIESVHERIAHFLKLHSPNPVPAWSIEFIANVRDQQLDWRKRLRELRYHPVSLEIEVSKRRDQKGVQSFYALKKWRELPDDLTRIIKETERKNKRKTKKRPRE